MTEYFATRPYETFAPTYAKILYEYGTIGMVAYAAFFFHAIMSRSTLLAAPLARIMHQTHAQAA